MLLFLTGSTFKYLALFREKKTTNFSTSSNQPYKQFHSVQILDAMNVKDRCLQDFFDSYAAWLFKSIFVATKTGLLIPVVLQSLAGNVQSSSVWCTKSLI